jgi:D-alanyl-lipoteichoic acid acyltransferase DltB (MBOAT superfamily)
LQRFFRKVRSSVSAVRVISSTGTLVAQSAVVFEETLEVVMAGISKDQKQQDMETLTTFLIFFNLALLGIFLLICFYQNL